MAKQQNSSLPSGSKLQHYKIDRVISNGGFSIVYLAYNENGIPVAIKEFLPAAMPLRSSGETLVFSNEEDHKRFQMGLRTFFKEAEAISRIDDRSIVRILNFFLANNTAYLVMPFEHGRTLQRIIINEFDTLDDAAIQRIFCDVLQAISLFHAHDILHLDLKPSNIWMRSDGSAMIIDFGTSRIGREAKNHIPPMHTPGFAAPEQHRKFYKADLIGPWTDIYNLGATIFSCIEGEPPPNAEERMDNDTMPSLESRWAGAFSIKMLRIVDKMIRLEHDERPRDAQLILQNLSRYTPMPQRDRFSRFAKQAFYKDSP